MPSPSADRPTGFVADRQTGFAAARRAGSTAARRVGCSAARPAPVLAALTLMFAGCAPVVQTGRYEPPADAPAALRLYENTVPDCAFEEIGTVQGARRYFWHSLDDVFDSMRRRAARMGGDAIVAVRVRDTYQTTLPHPGLPSVRHRLFYTGTVVRFTEACDDVDPVPPEAPPSDVGR